MKVTKFLMILSLSQLSVACMATPYEPTKKPQQLTGVAPPKSSLLDDVKISNCLHKFSKEQTFVEIANLAALMRQDCDLTAQQILDLAGYEFDVQ